ncbi:MAG: hypothetical protein WAU48_06555 [Gammaproteobacteria bacterium]
MRIQHVIHLDIDRGVLHTWHDGSYKPIASYSPRSGKPSTLLSFLRQNGSGTIGIIVDVLEEEHSRDRIARLRQRDQKALLERKLARTFPRTEFSTATLQGRSADKTQGKDVLFSALTTPDHVRTLVEQLAAAKLPVAWVCSPALLSLPVLEALQAQTGKRAAAALLVTRDQDGRLRVAFFRDRKLISSRLLRKSLSAPPGDMLRLLRQLEESVRYFDPSFIVSATNPVDVFLLGEPEVARQDATAAGGGHEGFHIHPVDLDSITTALGIRAQLRPGQADLLFLETLRRHAPAANYLPAGGRRYFQLEQIRKYARAACLVLGSAALLAGTWNGLSLMDTSVQARELANSRDTVAAGVQTHSEYQADSGMDPLQMRQVVSAWQALVANRTEPRAIFALVSRAVDQQPRLQIDALEWSPLAAFKPVSEMDPEESSDAPAATAEESGDDTGTSTPAVSRIRITVRGHIEPFERNYPLAFAELERFMASLRADPQVASVNARQQPLDIRPGSTLTGEVSREDKAEEATFAIDIVMRTGNDQA